MAACRFALPSIGPLSPQWPKRKWDRLPPVPTQGRYANSPLPPAAAGGLPKTARWV